MFREDTLLALANGGALNALELNQKMLQGLLHAAGLVTDIPRERLNNAIKDEVIDLNQRAHAAVRALRPNEETARLHEVALELTLPHAAYFPREEIGELLSAAQADATLARAPYTATLRSTLNNYVDKHRELERRLKYLLVPTSYEDVQKLDPKQDCDQIAYCLAYDFRTELKIIATLYELRAVVGSAMASFFKGTGEFSIRAVRRIMDTTNLFNNMTEWGLDSKRGRACIERVNGIHGRYYIHNDSFRLVLSGILFIPEEFNARLGWRRFSEVEKLGWFHAYSRLGRAMGIQGVTEDYNEAKAWYEEYCRINAFFNPIKRKLFDEIVCQVLAAFPAPFRAAMLSAVLVGMDDTYRRVTGYPEPPPAVIESVKRGFWAAGHVGAMMPRVPYLRSLQTTSVYPLGSRVEDLGVSRRSYKLPSLRTAAGTQPNTFGNGGHPMAMPPVRDNAPLAATELPEYSWQEIRKHDTEASGWVVVANEVYDITRFIDDHPGGRRILSDHLGADATSAFSRAKHSKEALVLMMNYRIGRVQGTPLSEQRPEAVFASAPSSKDKPQATVKRLASVEEYAALVGTVLHTVSAAAP